MSQDIIIIGSTAPDVLKLIHAMNKQTPGALNIIGFLDDNEVRHGCTFFGYPVLGPTALLATRYPDAGVVNNVARTTRSRQTVVDKITSFSAHTLPTLIHPSVDTSMTQIGHGCIIQEGVILGPGCSIGDHCVIYAHAVIGHEASLANTVFVANNAVIGARSSIGRGAFIGLNAVVFPTQTLGDWSTVGAGSVAFKTVEDGVTVFGNPARAGVLPTL
jgi:sugar O-acyltransferase (sialic acid O-acetyltransferase NeuD family)